MKKKIHFFAFLIWFVAAMLVFFGVVPATRDSLFIVMLLVAVQNLDRIFTSNQIEQDFDREYTCESKYTKCTCGHGLSDHLENKPRICIMDCDCKNFKKA